MAYFKFSFLLSVLVIGSTCLYSQDLDEDNNVLFLKANILHETSRYDEAIRLYNRILRDDPFFSRAFFMRGKSKYALGAFKGTKNDMMEYINQSGVDNEVLELMAETELKLENNVSALSYFKLLLVLRPYVGGYFAKAGNLLFENGDKNQACEYWIKGAKLGDATASKQATTRCAFDETIHLPQKVVSEKTEVETKDDDENEEMAVDDSVYDQNEEEEKTIEELGDEEIPESEISFEQEIDMEAEQTFAMDDELLIKITSGLGSRKVEVHPNILMLSDRSGQVAVDICVNSEGKVTSAQVNSGLSSIFRTSLSSLAIRKAKDFIFIPSLRTEQCGIIYYIIDTSK